MLLVYPESEQCVADLQGKLRINLTFFKTIGLKYLKEVKQYIVSQNKHTFINHQKYNLATQNG